MSLPITSLPLPHSLIKHLISQRVYCLSDLVDLLPWQPDTTQPLTTHQETNISDTTQQDIISVDQDAVTLSAVSSDSKHGLKLDKIQISAHEKDILLDFLDNFKTPGFISGSKLSRDKRNVVTFSAKLDDLLNGGVHPGEVLELVGESGSGCTQLCLQIAVDSTIPAVFGGLDTSVLYIDCEGDCSLMRLQQIASATAAYLKDISSTKKELSCEFTAETMLSKISSVRCTDYTQLIAILHHLKSNRGEYGVVIIDTLATHFRHDFQDMRQRTSILANVTNKLHELCITQNTAIVTVNQLMHTPSAGSDALQPCLGETWSHTPHRKLLLQQISPELYTATILKAPDKDRTSANFRISSLGIRDVGRNE